ncbi:MAG: beta-ketoacyl-[acyl-carrier-protein] synthase family protein [Chitinispirillia bacterium]|nr:beta-ketoacyl-[acyl-carrier-protein] synthase family protein [Chitinispirillia bacterium]MCL2267710.1 beta-ketoacyl-[acyl-carrier-protein] synthase family protein [Chitinispirillia bacterium]
METRRRVAVTGMGVAANNGMGKDAFYAACAGGVSGIRRCTVFSADKLMSPFFGEIPADLPDCRVVPTGETRVKAIMRLALDEMMRDSGLDRAAIEGYGDGAWICFGTLLANADGIMEYAERGCGVGGYLEHVNDYLPWLRGHCGAQGGAWVNSAACAASTTAAGMAFDFIRDGLCDICVVGGADSLTKSAAYGFHSLRSLSVGTCNPYDENRDGINIGEGAAFFIFEDMESAKARGARVYAEITGCGLANDAYHATSPDPNGNGLLFAMEAALRESEVSPARVQHINGHGTGTPVNDKMEIGAINRLFADTGSVPTVTSTKALIGHCMGGSGALELAAEILALEKQAYLPLPNLKNPIESAKEGMLSSKSREREAEYVLSNSLAFAGNVASVAFRRYRE